MSADLGSSSFWIAEAAKPLTVVISPADTGKTALLANWVAGPGSRVAWFSADVTDQDATQFWTGVVGPLE